MSGAKYSNSDDMFAAVGEVSKRMAEWDEVQAEQRRRRLTKVTEVVGEHFSDIEADILIGSDASVSTYRLRDMLPNGAEDKRGRWRIIVEFEPEEER